MFGHRVYFFDNHATCKANFSVDPKLYITFSDIQWSIAHRLRIEKEDESKYLFLKYVRNGYYINNPSVKNNI